MDIRLKFRFDAKNAAYFYAHVYIGALTNQFM